MPSSTAFHRVAIIGTGLIGGSFGLAIRARFPEATVIGFDREEVLGRAITRGAVQESAPSIEAAARRSDLVYIALPIGAAISALPGIAAAAGPNTLVTDACGAKALLCKEAAAHFKDGARFLGGHPMAGKEISGIENADPAIFNGAPYALMAKEPEAGSDSRVGKFVELVRQIGAKPVWCDAETHDWAVGIVSHLPQLVAVALAGIVSDETDETGLPLTLAGKGLHDMLRLAGSPYGVWRDVFLANRENAAHALGRLAQEIDHLRRNLSSKELEEEFRAANDLFALLHKEQKATER